MLRRVEPRATLRLALAAARLGGTCLALAIVVSAPAPEMVLALLAVVFLVVGGTVVTWQAPATFRWSIPVAAVVLARLGAGTGAALLAALLIGLGAWLRVGLVETTAGLAVFGAGVAVLGGASFSLILAFWLLGACLLLGRHGVGVARTRIARVFLTAERTSGRSLP